jgi:hypothetical protein
LKAFAPWGVFFFSGADYSMWAWIHVRWEWCLFPLYLTFSYRIRE